MNNKKSIFKTGKTGFVLNTVFLMALAGCVNYADAQIRISIAPPVVVVAPPVVVVPAPAVVVAEDNYVYYPSYGVYFNTSRNQYAYLDGGAWVSRPAPMGVSVDVLLASPSVKMDFHDSPANHHAAMMERYPRNYRAVRSEQKVEGHDGQKAEGRSEQKAEGHESHEGHDDHDKK